jgi:hypothetical protein
MSNGLPFASASHLLVTNGGTARHGYWHRGTDSARIRQKFDAQAKPT